MSENPTHNPVHENWLGEMPEWWWQAYRRVRLAAELDRSEGSRRGRPPSRSAKAIQDQLWRSLGKRPGPGAG